MNERLIPVRQTWAAVLALLLEEAIAVAHSLGLSIDPQALHDDPRIRLMRKIYSNPREGFRPDRIIDMVAPRFQEGAVHRRRLLLLFVLDPRPSDARHYVAREHRVDRLEQGWRLRHRS